jgi:hypothetical protein
VALLHKERPEGAATDAVPSGMAPWLGEVAVNPVENVCLIDSIREARAGAVGVDHERVNCDDGVSIENRAA